MRDAAAAAAGLQQYPPACLYVLATPIGNFADLSLRAIHVLTQLDALACEDTRVTAPLLQRLGLSVPLLAVHEHNEAEAAGRVIELLRQGQRVGFASDAGTPAVSDPGARLVAAVRAAGLRVMPLPGASSVSTVLSAAGAWSQGGGPSRGPRAIASPGSCRPRGHRALRQSLGQSRNPLPVCCLKRRIASARWPRSWLPSRAGRVRCGR